MQVHQCAGVFHHPLSGVYERFGKLYAVVDVVAAPPPVKTPPVVARPSTLVAVAVADLELPHAAGPGDGVDHARRGDGVHERRLLAAWAHGNERFDQIMLKKEDLFVLAFSTSAQSSYVFTPVCWFACLSASSVTQKLHKGFQHNFVERWEMGQEGTRTILVPIWTKWQIQ